MPRTFTGSGSAPTAQMEPLHRSGQREVHQHYWPEERGVAARLRDLAFGTYFPAGGSLPESSSEDKRARLQCGDSVPEV